MEISATVLGDVKVVHLKGAFGHDDPNFHKFIQESLTEPGNMIVDLSEITYISTMMIGQLLSLYVQRKDKGYLLKMAAPAKGTAKKIIEMVGIDREIEIFDTVRDAADSF